MEHWTAIQHEARSGTSAAASFPGLTGVAADLARFSLGWTGLCRAVPQVRYLNGAVWTESLVPLIRINDAVGFTGQGSDARHSHQSKALKVPFSCPFVSVVPVRVPVPVPLWPPLSQRVVSVHRGATARMGETGHWNVVVVLLDSRSISIYGAGSLPTLETLFFFSSLLPLTGGERAGTGCL